MTNLYDRAIKIPNNPKGTSWPDEHIDFFEAYIAFHTDSKTRAVKYEELKEDGRYGDFSKRYGFRLCTNRVSHLRQGTSPRSYRWQSLCLDGTSSQV